MARARERRHGLRFGAARDLPGLGLRVVLGVVFGVALAACDGASRAPDARARSSAETAEVSVRFDVSPGKTASVHVLAFRASVSAFGAPPALRPAGGALDQPQPDVLGTVDPLGASAPEQGCVLRDVALATSALGARGATIELEEMSGIGVGL